MSVGQIEAIQKEVNYLSALRDEKKATFSELNRLKQCLLRLKIEKDLAQSSQKSNPTHEE